MKLEDAEPNANHIIAVIQSLILHDTENALKHMMHYNLLFFMILHFDYFKVQEFFKDLIHQNEGSI